MPILLCMLPLRSLLLTSSFCLEAQRYFSLSSKSNSFIRTWLSVDYLGSIFPVHKEHFQYIDLNLLLLPECFHGFKFKYCLSCFFLLRNSNFTYHLYKSFSLWLFTFLHLIFILLPVFIFFLNAPDILSIRYLGLQLHFKRWLFFVFISFPEFSKFTFHFFPSFFVLNLRLYLCKCLFKGISVRSI